jgi:Tol biopolymer transport system component
MRDGTSWPVRSAVPSGFGPTYVAWHPSADHLAVWRSSGPAPSLVTVPVEGGAPSEWTIEPEVLRRLELARVSLGAFTWASSGRYLFFEGVTDEVRNVWRVEVDREARAIAGGPDRLTTGSGADTQLAVSPDGRRLALTIQSARTRLWQFPFDTQTARVAGPPRPVTSGGAGEYDAAATSDGSKLAFRTMRGGRVEVWQHLVGRGQETLLLTSSGRLTSPRWSPDGTKLAYARSRQGDESGRDVVVLQAASGHEEVFEVGNDFELVPDDWSSDGSTILAACRRPGGPYGTCLLRVTGSGRPGTAQLLASDVNRSLICQRFSPDERWISFMAVERRERGRSTLYVMPASGGPWVQMTDGLAYDDKPRWSADGRTLLFISNRGGFLNLWGRRFDPATGQPAGDAFPVTGLDEPRQLLAGDLGRSEIAVAAESVFLPVTERAGTIWVLENVDR